mmetsp:Transcript_3411/g.4065  ORF Transcript_3411/g.4065 Transcript_3411/m.4065 type:complete len:276 (-) Transcript_3411:170-997(-)
MEPEIAPAYALPCGVSEVTWVTPNKTLAVAADDSNVHILSLGSAEDDGNGLLELNLETVLSDHSNIVTSVSSIRSHVVSSSFDGNAKVWATKDLEAPMTTFNVSDGIVWEAKFMESGNEKIVTSASQNCGLQIWDSRQSVDRCCSILQVENDIACLSIDVFSETKLIACGTENGSLVSFDSRNPSEPIFMKHKLHSGPIHTVRFNSLGTKVASGADDTKIFITDVTDQQESKMVESEHKDYVRGLSWKPSPSQAETKAEYILSGSWDKTLKIHKL